MWKISRCKYLPLSGAGLAKGTKVFSLKVAKMSTRLVPRMLGQILDRGSNPFPGLRMEGVLLDLCPIIARICN